jgi:hypothetical protein
MTSMLRTIPSCRSGVRDECSHENGLLKNSMSKSARQGAWRLHVNSYPKRASASFCKRARVNDVVVGAGSMLIAEVPAGA